MICECDAPVPSHLRMSHTVIRKPRMHGSPERSPGVIEILESNVFTVSSPSLPALSHERLTVTRVFIPTPSASPEPRRGGACRGGRRSISLASTTAIKGYWVTSTDESNPPPGTLP